MITAINFSKKPFIEIWYLYKQKNKILIQLQYLAGYIFDERSKGLPDFTLETCYQYIPKFELYNKEGQEYQIWEADLDGIVTDNL